MMRERDERPYLACCEKARAYRLIKLIHVSGGIYDGLGAKLADVKPVWAISVPEHEASRLFDQYKTIREVEQDGVRNIIIGHDGMPPVPAPIEHCPFCGKKVPEVVKNPCPPPWICFCSDGGYYCDTCGERLHACGCAPAESLWTSPAAASSRRRWAAVYFGGKASGGGHYLGTMTPQMRHLVEQEWWDHFQPEDGNPEAGYLERKRNNEYFDELVEAQKAETKAKELMEQGLAPILSWHS